MFAAAPVTAKMQRRGEWRWRRSASPLLGGKKEVERELEYR